MKYRLAAAQDQSVPVTNYGIIIAYMNGILERSLQPLTKDRLMLHCIISTSKISIISSPL